MHLQIRFTSSHVAKFGCVPFADPCAKPGNEADYSIYGGRVKTLFEAVCGTKVTKFQDDLGDHLYFLVSLPDCLYRVIHKVFATKSRSCRKTEQNKSFWSPTFRKGRPRLFYGRLLVQFTAHRLAKFG